MPVIGPLAPHILNYQKYVFEYAKFLTTLQGRGGFYIFIGTLSEGNFAEFFFSKKTREIFFNEN
jgi:hypothetical protein